MKNILDLQLFAEEGEGAQGSQMESKETEKETKPEAKPQEKESAEKEKAYTEADIASIKKEQEEATKKAVAEALQEQKRLSELSAEERKKEEEKTKLKDLEEREKALSFKENLSEVKTLLLDKKLPTDFAAHLVGKDPKETLRNVAEFEEKWQKAVQEAVDQKIKGVTMKTGSSTSESINMAKIRNETRENENNPWA